jgi:hypothetical protein
MSSTSVQYQILIKALKSNWVHLVGIYFCIEAMMIVLSIIEVFRTHNVNLFLFQVLLSAPFLMFTYGPMFIGAFYLILILLDFLLFTTIKGKPFLIIIIEWLLIAPIFIYSAVKYEYWLWIALVTTFLNTQLIRVKKIKNFMKTLIEDSPEPI